MIDRNKYRAAIIGIAAYYGHKLSDEQVEMYAEDLTHVPLNKLLTMLGEWRRDGKNRTYPRPAELLEHAGLVSSESPEDRANIAMNKIWELIGKWGWNNTQHAVSAMGEFECEIVKRLGGWSQVCQDANVTDAGTWKAQTRELAKAILRREPAKFKPEEPRTEIGRNDLTVLIGNGS